MRRYAAVLIMTSLGACAGDVSDDDSDMDGGSTQMDARAPALDGGDAATGMDAAVADATEPVPMSSYAVCSLDNWCFERPRPTSQALYAGARAGDRELWVVGESGAILHYDGTGLKGSATEVTSTLRGVFAVNERDVWAVGNALAVVHYDGSNWSKVAIDSPDSGVAATSDLHAIWGASASDLWTVGTAGTVYRYNGTAWVKQMSPANVTLRSIWGTAADHVLAVGDNGTLIQFDGMSWARSTLPGGAGALNAVHGVSKTDVWVVGAAGRVLHYDGMAFKAVDLTLPKVDLYSVRAVGPKQAVVSGAGGAVYYYDGQMWRSRASGTTDALRALVADGADTLSIGDHGVVMRWSGEQRTVFSSGSSANYLDVFSAPQGSLFIAGDEVLRQGPSGLAPAMVESPRSFYDGFALMDNLAWAVGTSGTIARWDGTSFRTVESGTTSWLRGVWAASSTSVWVVGAKGLVLGLFNGTSFQPFPIMGFDKDLHDVWGSAADDVWAVGDAGSLLRWDGVRWSRVTQNSMPIDGGVGSPMWADTSLRALWGTAKNDVWAAGTLGTILHWNGSSWTTSQKGGGYTLHGLWGRSREDVYAVGSSGTILHFDGKTWTRERAPADVTLFGIGAGSDGQLRAVGESGVILYKRR